MIKPANIHIQIRQEEATMLMMLVDAGLIQLNAFDTTAQLVFGQKANVERQKEMMEKMFKLQVELSNQIYKKKEAPSLITV